MGNPRFESVLATDIGMKRKQNQDSGLSRPELGLFIVADGMGGHQGGEIASRVCVEKVAEYIEKNQNDYDPKVLEQGLQSANQAIYEQSSKDPKLKGMGTTATIMRISKTMATIIQVGDSRAYYWNKNGVWQLTRDHSLVQEKLRAGLITREQARSDDMKNVITRSVGYEPGVNMDRYQFPIERGDGFLLCSDGLSGPVDDDTMFEILGENMNGGLSLNETAAKLISTANSRGGDDNVTVVLVKIS